MRLVILYHQKSDHEGRVIDYCRDFERFKGRKPELVSLETTQGSEMASLYDAVRYPAILIIGPDGVLHKIWQEEVLPLMDEVEAYMRGFEPVFQTIESY